MKKGLFKATCSDGCIYIHYEKPGVFSYRMCIICLTHKKVFVEFDAQAILDESELSDYIELLNLCKERIKVM